MDMANSAQSLFDAGEERLKESLRRDLGPSCMAALADPQVIELMLNADGRLWIDRLGSGLAPLNVTMLASQAVRLFNTLAKMLNTVVTAEQPILEGELPLDGSRFEGLMPPLVARPIFAIRKKASMVFPLEAYRDQGILSDQADPLNRQRTQTLTFREAVSGLSHYDIIQQAIAQRKNILVVGSTGSGKTTLVNAVLDGIARHTPGDRIVLIEDTGEIQCQADNYVQLRASVHVDMTRLLRATMRLRPDRIIVGEVRGGEALALLKAWNTGHPGGLATVHANDCEAGLVRLEQLVQEAVDVVNPLVIAEAVDLIVFIEKDKAFHAGRKVRELAVVDGYDVMQRRYCIQHV